MTITLPLEPQKEAKLIAVAESKGMTANELVSQAIDQLLSDAPEAVGHPSPLEATNLLDLFAPVRGLLTDQEIDTLFSRNPSTSRPVDLS